MIAAIEANKRISRCKCGGGAQLHANAEIAKIECLKCGRTTGWMSPTSEAVGYWNYMNSEEAKE